MRTGPIFLVIVSLVFWRQYAWRVSGPKPQTGATIQETVRVWEKPVKTGTSWSIPYQAWKVRCYRAQPTCQSWKEIQTGDVFHFEGEWRQADSGSWFIMVKNGRVEKNHQWWWLWWRSLQKITDLSIETYRLNFSEPYASLLSGIVWGEQGELPNDFYQALITTGTIHVVAASGYNVTVVAGSIMSIMVLLVSRKKAWIGGVITVGIYVLMAGMSPPLVRAGLMGGLVLLAQGWGRLYRVGEAMLFVIALMVIIVPWMLVSVSFQLSVAATVGVIYGTQPVTRLLSRQKCPTLGWIPKEGLALLATTLAAILSTFPLVAFYFQRVSLVAPLTNLIVLGVVPPLMGLGVGVALVGWLPLLPQLLAWVTYPLLWWFVQIVEWTARLPHASLTIMQFNWWFIVGWWCWLWFWWRRGCPEED